MNELVGLGQADLREKIVEAEWTAWAKSSKYVLPQNCHFREYIMMQNSGYIMMQNSGGRSFFLTVENDS